MNHFPGQWAGSQILRHLRQERVCQFIILCFIHQRNQLLKSLFREPEHTQTHRTCQFVKLVDLLTENGPTELNTDLIVTGSWRPNRAVRDRASDLHSVRSKHWTDISLRRDVKLLRIWERFRFESFVSSENSSISGKGPFNDLSALNIFTNSLSSTLSKTKSQTMRNIQQISGWCKSVNADDESETLVCAGVWCVWRAVWVLWERWRVSSESGLVLRANGPELSPQICRSCWVILHSE